MKNFLIQFEKFAIVGSINTIIDFSILNILMNITNVYKGSEIMIFNTISFTLAVINSYILNRNWTFKNKSSKKPESTKFIKFLIIAIAGTIINTAIVYGMTTLIIPMFGLSIKSWANFAKIIATVVVLGWNFTGYKFLVFQ